jgi:signal transduction histidine kinase/ActR/RegA family two-component response regulator
MDLNELISFVTGALFVAVAARLATKARREPGSAWAGAAFGALAAVSVMSTVGEAIWPEIPPFVQKLEIAALLLFPLLLWRFTMTLAPIKSGVRRAGDMVTGALIVWALLIPEVPEEQEKWPVTFVVFLFALLGQWTFLSVASVALLWRQARGQPSVARRRMRFLGAAILMLNMTLIGAAVLTGAAAEIVQLLGVLSALGFLVAFAPPAWLRGIWRRPEEVHLQDAVSKLMAAQTPAEIASALLPHVVAVIGAQRAALLDEESAVVACYVAADNGEIEPAADGSEFPRSEGIAISRSLMVWTGPAAPLFAGEELSLLATLGTLSDLAVDRARLFQNERGRSSSLEELARQLGDANRALELEVKERQDAQQNADAAKSEAERANRAKSEFLSRMSHELRTPLNSILGFAQLLETDDLTDDQQESVHHVLKGGRHLLTLIDEVLDIATVESGRMTVSTEPVKVSEVVPEVLDLLRPAAAERNITMTVEGDELDSLHVLADRQRLKQILINLVGNGIKYNRHAGFITVSIDRNGSSARVTVTDTGAGLSPEKIDRLFIPFDRLGAETTTVEGTGLGLALSKGLVELMGGTLRAVSKEGQGTTFYLDLPITDPTERPASQRPLSGSWSVADQDGSLTVLYIEDNLANVQLVERILRSYPGVKLLTAMQGQVGLELARHHQPDLVLLDIHLPDVEGGVVLKQLRAEPALRETSVVILSADATRPQVRRLKEAGADEYLTKPINVRRFRELVDSAIAKQATVAIQS